MQASDENTLNTLRALKQTGMLRAKNAQGELMSLDASIAADLLNGEKITTLPAAPNSMTGLPLHTNPLTIPRHNSPLPTLDDDERAAKSGRRKSRSAENLPTEELMRRLSGDCEAFNSNLLANFNTAKDNMQRNLLELFQTVSKEKLPDSFLKSLPKWGKNATKLHHVFNRSANRKRTESSIDRKEIPFDLVIQPEILEEIDDDIHKVIYDELQQCVGEKGVIITDIQRILGQVSILMERLRILEERLAREETEACVLQERLHDERLLNRELADKIDALNQEAREKEIQMDILRDQVQREREQARQKRADFFKEICRYKTQILHLMANNEEMHERVAAHPKSPRKAEARRESSAEGGVAEFGFSMGADHSEVQLQLEQREKELRAEFQELVRVLKAQHAEALKQAQQQKKLLADEKDEQIATLKEKLRRVELELVEERRKIRKVLGEEGGND